VWLALLLLAVLSACGGTGSGVGEAPSTSRTVDATTALVAHFPGADQPPSDWNGSTVSLDDVPPEVLSTLQLITNDGPYPYSQDGSTFQNREGNLPANPGGFYREYTVETPGSPDRGARRLVVGDDRAIYYTDDHYESFRFLMP
jgi:ribonuclease T1